MIKLIVSDLDGTLLNSKQQISDRTLRAIKQIQRKGLRLLINTEQNYFDAKKILDAYNIPCDIACFGGSCIFDASGHQLRGVRHGLSVQPPGDGEHQWLEVPPADRGH